MLARSQALLQCLNAALVGLLCASLPHASGASWKFMVYGDTRALIPSSDFNEEIVAELVTETVRLQPAFVVVPGDLVFNGSPTAFANWRAAMSPVYDAGIGVYPQVGNHDVPDMVSWGEILGPGIPDNGPAGQMDQTYFVRHENALLLSFDQFAGPGYYDPAWLESILATNTASHIFAAGHMPAFKVVHDDMLDDDPSQRDAFWRTLVDSGCRAYFCGHDHFFDHLRAGDGDGNPENDMHQLIVGTGGATLYGDGIYDGWNAPWNPTRVFHENNYGYVLVEIDNLNVTVAWYRRAATGAYERSEDVWSYIATHRPALKLESEAGGTAVCFTARAGMRYVLERSADLASWLPVATNNASGRVCWPIMPNGSDCGIYRIAQHTPSGD